MNEIERDEASEVRGWFVGLEPDDGELTRLRAGLAERAADADLVDLAYATDRKSVV